MPVRLPRRLDFVGCPKAASDIKNSESLISNVCQHILAALARQRNSYQLTGINFFHRNSRGAKSARYLRHTVHV